MITSVTFGMYVAISKQRFLYLRSILWGHFVTFASAPVMVFALHAIKTFDYINCCEKKKEKIQKLKRFMLIPFIFLETANFVDIIHLIFIVIVESVSESSFNV